MSTAHCSVTNLSSISHKYNEIKIIKWQIMCPSVYPETSSHIFSLFLKIKSVIHLCSKKHVLLCAISFVLTNFK